MPAQTKILLGVLALAFGLWVFSRTAKGQQVVASVTQYIGDALTPHGIRNNNPGNIERSNIQWNGSIPADQVQQLLGVPYDTVYEQYVSPDYGVRAIGHVLKAKVARGLTSVDAIIRDYSATDQDAYVANVAKALGVDETQDFDVVAVLPAFAAAIIQQENGRQPYELSDIANWVYS